MKKLTLYFALSSALSVLLFEAQPAIKYNLQDDIYHRLQDRIFDPNPSHFDIAFIGSSHIWNAVNTETINARHPELFTYNFGVNWFGNDTKLVILRDLLEHKPVKRVVIEITNEDDHEKHEYFKFLATSADLPLALRTAWRNVGLKDVLTLAPKFKSEVEYLAGALLPFTVKGYYFTFRQYIWTTPPVDPADHAGFLGVDRTMEFSDPSVYLGQAEDGHKDVYLSEPIKEIARLCDAHGAKLYFLFVPYRNDPFPGKKYVELLSELGTVIQLDAAEYYRPQYWYNRGHLNISGSKIFTDKLLQSVLFAPLPSTGDK